MAPKEVHPLPKHCSRRPVATFRPKEISSYFIPLTLLEIKFIEIVSVMAVVAPEDIQLVVVNDSAVRMSGRWTSLGVNDLLQGPATGIDIVFMKIIHSVEPIVAPKNIDGPLVDYCSVSVSRRWRRVVYREDFGPLQSFKIEFEEIVSPVSSVVAPENVKVVVKGNGCVQGPRTRRVVLV
jgi:hypothetical protein